MKYSVSSYSFSQFTSAGAYTEKQLIALAKECGFDGIEFAEIHTPDGLSKKEYAAQLKAEAEKQEMDIVAYCIGADVLNDTASETERLKGEIDIAQALGVKLVRHDASSGYKSENRLQRGFLNALPIIADAYKQLTQYAESKGIRTCIENHGLFCQDSARVEAIINSVADDNFGALIDLGNFMCADENPAIAVGNLAPYAFHVHAKDFHFKKGGEFIPPSGFFMTRGGNFLRGAIIGHGDVPVLQCLRILKNAGYRGYISVEFEGMEDAKKGVKCGLESLKSIEELI